ncbi:hypothetical protein MTQ01_04310 [Streptomyces sp. XM4193]|uniref:hypothetical protein n=1 Tax=Streptomyces sp. XM4193 TaxID=2929782 RepID=UPI001FFA3150|nr:hypothetical protein [Streptomyces sp. XM4193]MCK1795244.1 hypothetical protein [Streptomyces sp. XM4193]
MDFVTSALLVSWVAIALLALVVSGLVRQVHQLSRGGGAARTPGRVGVAPGSPAPHAAELLAEDRPTLLLFLSPDCRTCVRVLAEADRVHTAADGTDAAGGPAVRAVYADEAPAETHSVPVLDHRPDLFTAYDAIATPFAVLVAAGGRVLRSEPLGAPEALHELLAELPASQPRSA